MEENKTTLVIGEEGREKKVELVEVPGHLFLRRGYYDRLDQTRLVILMVDAADESSIQHGAELVYSTLTNKKYNSTAVIIVANKQDLPKAKKSIQLENTMRLEM